MTYIFGHRGASGTEPENTMDSFRTAAAMGVDGIELDVQLSKDGVVVVIHDETVDRTTNGHGWVCDHTFDELHALDASNGKKHRQDSARIPSLEEVLIWLKSNQLLVNIEFKNSIVPYPELVRKTIGLVREYELESRTIFSSFHHESIVESQALAPDIRHAVLTYEQLYRMDNYLSNIGIRDWHMYFAQLRPEEAIRLQQLGHGIRLYTLNNEAQIKQWLEIGVDTIMSDFPDVALRLRG
ncbi:MAG: glycerophosphodiester phosphodiesterase [Bacilli bacterium]